MNEPLVSFEIAQMLKEAGYNWPTRDYYFDNEKNDLLAVDAYDFNNKWPDCFSRPALSQASAWLREQGLHVWAQPIGQEGAWIYQIADLDKPRFVFGCALNFPDHDTALTSGIKQALTILKERAK